MSDKEEKRDIGHAMFGLGEQSQTGQNQNVNQGPGGPAYPPGGQGPQYVYVQGPPPWSGSAGPPARSGGRAIPVLVAILIVLAGVNLWLVLTLRSQSSDQATLLSRRLDASDDHYAQLKAQFDVTAQKLGLTQQELSRARRLAASIQTQQKQNVQQLNAAIQQKASAQDLNKLQAAANSKFGSLSGDIAGTQKDLDATKQALTGTKSELSGAIARTHTELVALAHRTDRDYFEFNVSKKHQRQRVGGVSIELTRTNPKKNLYTVNLYFDDKRTERKNNALDQPIFFYVQGAPDAIELVVNKLGKNSISGYLSAPKGFYKNTPNVLTERPS